MPLEVTGTLVELFDTQQVSEKFKKREFVISIKNGQYEDPVLMQVVQDKTSLLDDYQKGAEITVSFNLRGRASAKEGTTRYFSTIEAWRIEPAR